MNRLLIVDDALIMRKMLRDLAGQAGWQVVAEAADGLEAVARYREHRPDLVTMDLVMPELGGIDAMKRIRAEDPSARVIVVTALDQKSLVAAAIDAGALDFVVKPFDRDRMVALLQRLAGDAPPGPAEEEGRERS